MPFPPRGPQLTRKLLDLVEKDFPIRRETRDVDGYGENASPYQYREKRQLQNPLLFLAECARQDWGAKSSLLGNVRVPEPISTLPPEDVALLDMWAPTDVRMIMKDQHRYFEYGLFASKRDVGRDLDPVIRGVVKQEEVDVFFDG